MESNYFAMSPIFLLNKKLIRSSTQILFTEKEYLFLKR